MCKSEDYNAGTNINRFNHRKIIEGITQAQEDYANWTGGEWLWNAPEYMLTVYIARKISELSGAKYLSLETNVKATIKDAGAQGRGKLHSGMRPKGRFDILLWWGSYATPRAVIEVKNQIAGVNAIEADLLRIREVLKRNRDESSFQFGVIAYYTSCRDNKKSSAKDRIEERIEKIHQDAQDIIGDGNEVILYYNNIHVEGDSAWVPVALLIK